MPGVDSVLKSVPVKEKTKNDENCECFLPLLSTTKTIFHVVLLYLRIERVIGIIDSKRVQTHTIQMFSFKIFVDVMML